jgi:hypothetical protein
MRSASVASSRYRTRPLDYAIGDIQREPWQIS